MKSRKQKGDSGRRKYSNRKSVKYIVVIYVVVHLLFLSSHFIPDSNKYTASEFRISQTLSRYSFISLIRWEYAPSENTMEVVFDMTNTLYQEGTVSMLAKVNDKQLDTKIVYSDQNMLIVQIYNVPKAAGNRIVVEFEYEENGEVSVVDFYTYVDIVDTVSSLPVLSEKEYYYNRQVYDIDYYNSLVSSLEKKIESNKEKIKNLEADLKRLGLETQNLTTDELLNLDETISNDTQTIESLERQILDYENKIEDYQDTIRILEERRDACE